MRTLLATCDQSSWHQAQTRSPVDGRLTLHVDYPCHGCDGCQQAESQGCGSTRHCICLTNMQCVRSGTVPDGQIGLTCVINLH